MAKPAAHTDPKKLEKAKAKAHNNYQFAQKKLKIYDALIKQDLQVVKQLTGKMEADRKNIKSIAAKIEYAEWAVGLAKSLAKIAGASVKIMAAQERELRKNSEEIGEGLLDIIKDKLVDMSKELAEQQQDDDSIFIRKVSEVVTLLGNWISPTFWGYAIGRGLAGNTTWSETVFMSIGGEMTAQAKKLKVEQDKRLTIYRAARGKAQKASAKWHLIEQKIGKMVGGAKKAA